MIVSLDRRTFVGGGLWLPVPPPIKPPVEPPEPPPSLDNAHHKLVMKVPGQITDADLLKADVYYRSGDITPAIRDGWDAWIEKYRDTWTKPLPEIVLPINDRTKVKMYGWTHFASVEPYYAHLKNVPKVSQGGVLQFHHREGWPTPESKPTRNFRHVNLNLLRTKPHPAYTIGGLLDWHKPDVDYETGFTFWQGGTPNWLRDIKGSVAIWQTHSDQGAWMYLQVTGYGKFTLSGFTRGDVGSDTKSFPPFTIPNRNHNDVHVIKVQYRYGKNGYFRLFYNGVRVVNVTTKSISGWTDTYQQFMNYQTCTTSNPERVLNMDRCYRRAL